MAPLRAAPHPPAQLVELRQAKVVGTVDDDRVGVGDVQPILDDRRRHQHVDVAVGKTHHHIFQLALVHLPVTDRDDGLGHQALDAVRQGLDAVNAVCYDKDLALAVQFALDRLLHQHVVVLGQHGMDRLALFGRRVDRAHVANAAQAHVQRARDRRGAQRQHVHLGAQLLELLLLRHAKALLFVDDQQPQVLEFHILAEQAMRADHQVDRARTAGRQ